LPSRLSPPRSFLSPTSPVFPLVRHPLSVSGFPFPPQAVYDTFPLFGIPGTVGGAFLGRTSLFECMQFTNDDPKGAFPFVSSFFSLPLRFFSLPRFGIFPPLQDNPILNFFMTSVIVTPLSHLKVLVGPFFLFFVWRCIAYLPRPPTTSEGH